MSDKKYTSIHRENAAGRIEFSGGKAVWQWSQASNDSTSILIKSLDNPELELEKTQRTPSVPPRANTPQTARSSVKNGGNAAAPERASSQSTGEADEGETLRQLRAMRKRSFDPYNRS